MLGNIQSKTDGNGLVNTYAYDEFNKLKSVTNPKGEATSYTYDLNGNMLTQTDGNGNTTTYRYNAGDKLSKKTDPGGKTESYTYYADGSMKAKTDRNGKTTSYTYDVYGRLLNRTNGAAAVSYTYDNNGNQLTMTDSTGTTVRTYDGIGRVLTKIVPKIGTSIYEYDRTDGLTAGYSEEKTTNTNFSQFSQGGRTMDTRLARIDGTGINYNSDRDALFAVLQIINKFYSYLELSAEMQIFFMKNN